MSEPLTSTLTSKESSERKALGELSRGLGNTPGIPLWHETDPPKNLRRKNDDAWQVHGCAAAKSLPRAGETCKNGPKYSHLIDTTSIEKYSK